MYGCMHVCMYACMHACMYACIHVCMYHVCMYACMYVCTYAYYIYICMRIGMSMCMCICICISACLCVCIQLCVCKWVCEYAFTCGHAGFLSSTVIQDPQFGCKSLTLCYKAHVIEVKCPSRAGPVGLLGLIVHWDPLDYAWTEKTQMSPKKTHPTPC